MLTNTSADIVIVGAGPVGLMCAYLAQLCGLRTVIIDISNGPLEVGKADALNARTLQLLEIVNLFDALYPLGKICNTSSVWQNGQFISRQSKWWDELQGCFHKHFIMLGQSYIEKLLDNKLVQLNAPVLRNTSVEDITLDSKNCHIKLSNNIIIETKYIIGSDGSRSFVRNHFNIKFNIVKPKIIWAVIDGIIETDFPKVPEIIVFQNSTADVAWIPREGDIDRFYARMDTHDFTFDDAINKIELAITPHKIKFTKITWFSQFSVKESVAEKFSIDNKIFLAGDACHIHSVNGGQGLNTGLADAFNLIWKLNMVINHNIPSDILNSYEAERQPVALSVIEASGKLVRSTRFSANNTHAKDYVDIVEKYSGNITGMGIQYEQSDIIGTRVFDFEITTNANNMERPTDSPYRTRLYTLLDYTKYTLLIFSDHEVYLNLPNYINIIQIHSNNNQTKYWSPNPPYENKLILIRPDSYIKFITDLDMSNKNNLMSNINTIIY